MVIGKIDQSFRVEPMHPLFKQAFDYIKRTDFDKLPLGRIELDGDRLYINHVDTAGADASTQPLEMHRRYIDIHVLLAGSESIGWKPIEEIENYTQPYAATGDCALSDDRPRFMASLNPGEYCIVFPEDTHAPAISKGEIHKLIVKVLI